MMCAAFLSKNFSHKVTLSDRMMNFFQRIYAPLLEKAIRFKKVVVGTLALFVVSVFYFQGWVVNLYPTLQEGDFAFHCILTARNITFTKFRNLYASIKIAYQRI
jgi:cobalt-zinc-cadmium resistance protein CzcA